MRLPWSVQQYLRYRRVFTFRSYLRLRSALIREGTDQIGFLDPIELRMRSPFSSTIRVRPRSNDIFTISEVLLDRVYAAAVARVPGARTVLDLGANIGLASLYLASSLPAARVVAVEPYAENFRLLEHNLLALAAVGRALALRAALCDRDTPVAFLPPVAVGHVDSGTVCPVDQLHEPPDRAHVVPGYSMRTLFEKAGFDTVDLLKVDIEGAERALFVDHQLWLPRVRALAIEFHNDSREACGFDEVMKRNGFHVSDDNGHTVVAVRRDGAR